MSARARLGRDTCKARAVLRLFLRMTKDKVRTAIEEGIPFVIKMADGEKYKVSDRYRVALGNTTVIVVGDDDMPHVLPLLTMTGISYLKAQK
jgi:hypothetical protein